MINSKRIAKLILLGYPNTKRTAYFLKAARELDQDVRVLPLPRFTCWEDFDFSLLAGGCVKVDPPLCETYLLDELSGIMDRYHRFLLELKRVPGIVLMNTPEALWQTLDKGLCKKRLQENGLPATPLLEICSEEAPASFDSLKNVMRAKKICQVFIKPRLGSGAAGVVAFRLNPRTGGIVMETSCRLVQGRLHNTRELCKTSDPGAARETINALLAQDAIVEKWIPKASYQGQAYDLRAVFQFGRLDYMVARRSRGSVTNLHLNNGAVPVEDLALSPDQTAGIDALCRRAVELFPRLNAAGIDILLEKHSLRPMIIEINGQGDLIYQDIFAENRIYKAQIKAMLSLQQ